MTTVRPNARVYAISATCLAAALALLLLDDKSFWLDEAMSVSYAAPGNSLARVVLQGGGNMAFYYLLLHQWLRLGSSDWFVRLLSVIPAVLSVPLLFALGRVLFGIPAAIFASFLLAINAFFIQYAQQARGYSLVLLASVASMFFFIRLLERKSLVDLLGYVMASVLLVATHFFGLFVLAAQALALLASDRRLVPWASFGIAVAVIVFALLPLARAAHRLGLRQIQWIPSPSLHATGIALASLAGNWALAVCYLLLAVYAIVLVSKRAQPERRDAVVSPIVVTILWFLIPIVGAIVVSKLVQPIFVDRYLIVSLPALALIAGFGLARVRPPFVQASVCAVLVFFNALALSRYYTMGSLQDWRGVAGFIAGHAEAHDVVICYPPYMLAPLQHAVERLARTSPELKYVKTPFYPEIVAGPRSTAIVSFASDLGRSSRVWAVTVRETQVASRFERVARWQTEDIMSLLGREGKKVTVHDSFTGIDVGLYVVSGPRSTVGP